jgi:hypothetical protein
MIKEPAATCGLLGSRSKSQQATRRILLYVAACPVRCRSVAACLRLGLPRL